MSADKHSISESGRIETILLLGPTGSGKTPLGDWLERTSLWGRRCHHFDFGAELRGVVAGDLAGSFAADEILFLRRVLAEGVLLEAEHFPLAARILDAFIARKPVQRADLLILNGLPRHLAQAKAVDGRLKIILVVQLECDARTVAERLRRDSGGDRARRSDDTAALLARKLAIYEERTRPLRHHYRERGVPVLNIAVGLDTQPADLACRLGARRAPR